VILSTDGRSVYVQGGTGLQVVDLATGAAKPVTVNAAVIPKDRNKHGGVCGRWDGCLYNCSGQGSGPKGGVLFRVDLAKGGVEILYDSLSAEDSTRVAAMKAVGGIWSGPADAVSLHFSSTKFQVQCPRTGAVYNSGWDGAGVPRYHDGFVSCFAHSSWGNSRPEWKDRFTATFGNDYVMDIAPNGDKYVCDLCNKGTRHPRPKQRLAGYDREELVDGIRLIRMWRTDWPEKQPVAGYWNSVFPPEEREKLMLEHCRNYIANYAELSKIY
jgi:hypothetical protein